MPTGLGRELTNHPGCGSIAARPQLPLCVPA